MTWRVNSTDCNMNSEIRINLCRASQEIFTSVLKEMPWEHLKKFSIYDFEPHFAKVAENRVINRMVIASPLVTFSK